MNNRLLFLALSTLSLAACDPAKHDSGEPDVAIDGDGDGFMEEDDCDDADPDVFPGADERCNGIDDDCDGEVDEEAIDALTFYADLDGDGHGDAGSSTSACSQFDGWVTSDDDCDDADAEVNPSAVEICNELDDDCDGAVDDDDDSLDLATAETWHRDADTDGYGDPDSTALACITPDGYSADASDCDDGDAAVSPEGLEICNGVDDDCDELVDDDDDSVDTLTGSAWYMDADGDGWGDPRVTTQACEAPEGWLAGDLAADCDDADATIHPEATEICDELDNDCDGATDDADADLDVSTGSIWYADGDGDGYGDAASTAQRCELPSGYVADDADCDDGDAAVNPAASEVCNGVDDDCDGDVDDADADVDVTTGSAWYMDADGDGWGDPRVSTYACDAPSGWVDGAAAADCDDDDSSVSPAATEVCNGVDDDCDGDVDDADASLDPSTHSTWYEDADGDGWGNAAMSVDRCDALTGFVATAGDCLDIDASVNPDATEACNGVDDDCDGAVDAGVLGHGAACAAEDCLEVLVDQPSALDGDYWIDPTGASAYEVLCDMSTDGGGWTLAATGSDDGVDNWTWDARGLWTHDTTPVGDIDHPFEDFKSPAHHEVVFEDLLFVHQPSGTWAEYDEVGDASGSFADFLGGFSDSECYVGDDGWPMTAGTLTVTGYLCSTDVFFNAMDNDGGSCSSHDDSAGPAWSTFNNVGCPLDDVGHNGFGPNKLYPSAESDASTGPRFGAGFGGAIGGNTGALGAAENYIQVWVR